MGTGAKIPNIKVKAHQLRSISREAQKFRQYVKPINFLIIHDNRLDYHTQKAHRLAEWMKQTSEFNPIIDKDYFDQNKNYSSYQINVIEKNMVKIARAGIRLIAPSSITEEPRHEGSMREFKKFMNGGKPIIEIFYQGARDSPNRPIQEKNYKYRVAVHIKRGESLQKAIERGWNDYLEIKKKERVNK